ncbi:MAG: Hsp20 family protein [Candidatus Berkelbacteria bacterium]|nr:Hsp20 family protein [Candidatus Berkelbacteria bacterium]
MVDEKDITIENRLRDFRKKQSLSQEELADKLGISRQSVISLEQGKSMPSLPLAVSLCQFFDTAFEDMFEFEREIQQIGEALDRVFDQPGKSISINIANGHGDIIPLAGKENEMVDLEPWRPFREAISLRDAMDKLFEDSVITPGKMTGMPKVDIVDKKNSVVVKAEVPGVAEDDINIEILDNVMTISGEKREEKEDGSEDKGYYYKESHTGGFSRSFSLPSEVVADKAEAAVKNGVLTVTIPKIEPKKAKKIAIKK